MSDRNSMLTTLNSQQRFEEAKQIHEEITQRGQALQN